MTHVAYFRAYSLVPLLVPVVAWLVLVAMKDAHGIDTDSTLLWILIFVTGSLVMAVPYLVMMLPILWLLRHKSSASYIKCMLAVPVLFCLVVFVFDAWQFHFSTGSWHRVTNPTNLSLIALVFGYVYVAFGLVLFLGLRWWGRLEDSYGGT